MDPLQLSYSDGQGGAARAAYRLHRGLRAVGIDSEMVVNHKLSADPSVHGPGRAELLQRGCKYLRKRLDRLPLRRYLEREDRTFSPGWVPERIQRRVASVDPDLVNVHWVGNGFLRVETLRKIDCPVVWTLHDMWPFTGGCHYSHGCTRYTESCGNCPLLNSDWSDDISRRGWRRKRAVIDDLNVRFVAPSEWLAARLKESTIGGDATVDVIPNGLDTGFFRPVDTTEARRLFDLPEDRDIVLTGADYVAEHKGFHHVAHAIEERRDRDIEWVFFGNSDLSHLDSSVSVRRVSRVSDRDLPLLYSSADLMVVPSEQEAFGQTASEALAAGTPVVAFDAVGPRDIVEHEKTGYLADPFDSDDLVNGIDWVLDNEARLTELGNRARDHAVNNFSREAVARRYAEVYGEVTG